MFVRVTKGLVNLVKESGVYLYRDVGSLKWLMQVVTRSDLLFRETALISELILDWVRTFQGARSCGSDQAFRITRI